MPRSLPVQGAVNNKETKCNERRPALQTPVTGTATVLRRQEAHRTGVKVSFVPPEADRVIIRIDVRNMDDRNDRREILINLAATDADIATRIDHHIEQITESVVSLELICYPEHEGRSLKVRNNSCREER